MGARNGLESALSSNKSLDKNAEEALEKGLGAVGMPSFVIGAIRGSAELKSGLGSGPGGIGGLDIGIEGKVGISAEKLLPDTEMLAGGSVHTKFGSGIDLGMNSDMGLNMNGLNSEKHSAAKFNSLKNDTDDLSAQAYEQSSADGLETMAAALELAPAGDSRPHAAGRPRTALDLVTLAPHPLDPASLTAADPDAMNTFTIKALAR